MLNADKQRELAYIVTVDDVQPIEGYDRIRWATVNGWHCVVGLDINKGDTCVYFEVDSLLDATNPVFAFCERYNYKVKVQKYCKGTRISQGLLMPLSAFPQLKDKKVGDFVTKELNITYYDPMDVKRKESPSKRNFKPFYKKLMKYKVFRKIAKTKLGNDILFALFGVKKKKRVEYPWFCPKTDEERIQNCPYVLDGVDEVEITEKVDGCLDYTTSIVTSDGLIQIGEIVNKEMPVKVLSYNHDIGECQWKEITGYHKLNKDKQMYGITVNQRGYKSGNKPKTIKCTSNHKFYTQRGYVEAENLTIDDTIFHRCIVLNDSIQQILLGMLLGDASLCQKNGSYSGGIDFCHSEKQVDYFNEIIRLLGENQCNYYNATSGYGSPMKHGHFYSNYDFKQLVLNTCIKNNKKYVTKEWCNLLTPLSLAFWYMDDGSIENADSDSLKPKISIATNNFSIEEVQNLSDCLWDKFRIKCEIRTKESYKGNVLIMNTEATDRFCWLIAPYICNSMKYKLPKYIRNVKYCLDGIILRNTETIVETEIKNIEKIDIKRSVVYDLTVKDNHNYFANGILVHNCSSTFAVERDKKGKLKFYVCSRNVVLTRDTSAYYDTNYWFEMYDKYKIEDFLRDYITKNDCDWVYLQGETYGDGVQKRNYSLKGERDFRAFILADSNHDARFSYRETAEILKPYGIPTVPILGTRVLPTTVDEVMELAQGKSEIDGLPREGLVFRSIKNPQISFKAVDPEFILKYHG